MLTRQGILRVRQDGPVLTFQLDGRATMHHSPAMRQRAEQALASGVQSLRVDLRHCTYMDSTFLGTLLCFTRLVQRKGQGDFALVCPSPGCLELLQQMRLDRIYPVMLGEELPEDGWTILSIEGVEIPRFQHTVEQAHQELAELPGPAGAPFRPIARLLEQGRKPADTPPRR